MKRLAIIPARGGSKRIPRKNIKPFLGKPIIAYSIEAAQASGIFDEIMVSTDDEEIAHIAKQYGASVPFMRSEATSNDFAGLAEVIDEVIIKYKQQGITFDQIACMLATAPFLTQRSIQESYRKLIDEQLDAVISVLQFNYPIQRALQLDNGKLKMVWEEYRTSRSQDLPSRYHDSGQLYWLQTGAFEVQKKIFAENAGAIILSEKEVQDIDTPEDWEMAEIKYTILHNISR